MVDRNPLNRLESSGYDRDQAESDLKATAVESSQHSSGNVLDMADKKSAYAHGNEHLLNKVDENTSMPSTDTTVDGAYSIGHTSTAGVADNYSQAFPERDTHTVGTGSRTIQTLPSHVQDLGTTVQTNRTQHILQTEADPVTYIPPQTGAYTSSANTIDTSSGGGRGGLSTGASQAHVGSGTGTGAGTTTSTGATTTHTTGLPAGETGVVHHHGIVGENRTIEPTNAQYNVNAGSGVAVGTSSLGMPHGTQTAHANTTSSSHAAHTTGEEKKTKESMFSKIKHALQK